MSDDVTDLHLEDGSCCNEPVRCVHCGQPLTIPDEFADCTGVWAGPDQSIICPDMHTHDRYGFVGVDHSAVPNDDEAFPDSDCPRGCYCNAEGIWTMPQHAAKEA